ncbi:AAA family ATPase [Bifidobacterium catulorum]|uniref:ATPase AAA-type core domain-containing protein n=1 Tax=Bifidobacterium catulorum TaxID=1630173 RepID=A0A2U2MQ76_9BIFI|nr:ATP-binding protein [Bifidobacterium catulorum]PWG58991.1 hypothetical protein DF200_09955 [Bifidobacterium catulorum]
MLIDFSFSNYRSFKSEQSFSMARDSRFSEGRFGERSTVTAIYGPNASGKSNFLKALWTMATLVRTSYSRGDVTTFIDREPFLLRNNAHGIESMFYADFLADDSQRYRYWFRCNDSLILHEELSLFKTLGDRLSTHATKLFSRDGGEVSFGGSFRGPKAQVRKTVELRPNSLVLSASAAAGIKCTQAAYEFFSSSITYCDALGFQGEQPLIIDEFNRSSGFSAHLQQLIRYADFGIDSIRSVPVNADPVMLDSFKEQLKSQLGADSEKLDRLFNDSSAYELRFVHNGEETVQFGVQNESRGTLAALSFFSLALRQLARPTVTLVDEIDTSLHPALVREFIRLFTDPATNPHGSQIIFTTHDVSLITTSGAAERLIDPDQVWLVEKTSEGDSELYPVTDLKVRKEENIGRNYLNGIYGGVPRPSFHTAFTRIMEETDES